MLEVECSVFDPIKYMYKLFQDH